MGCVERCEWVGAEWAEEGGRVILYSFPYGRTIFSLQDLR